MDLLTLERGRTRVTVAPKYGGRIAQIAIQRDDAWLPLLHEPAEPMAERDPLLWGSYALVPWPNRITGGTFTFRGERYDLTQNDGANALHGLGYAAAWRLDEVTPDACTLSLVFGADWPFGGHAEQRIEVTDRGVRQRVTLYADTLAYPCGTAWHPWFRRDIGNDSAVRVRVDADERYELDALIPTGQILTAEGVHDLRAYPTVGDRLLDDCYRGVRDPLRLRWSDIELTMTSSANARHAVVYTQPPASICLEPQTCAIDAFNLSERGMAATGIGFAEPGRPFSAGTAWDWRVAV